MSDLQSDLQDQWEGAPANFGNSPPNVPVSGCAPAPTVGPAWKKAADDIFPGQQSFQNCGIQSTRQIIEQATGKKIPLNEQQLLEDAIQKANADKHAIHPLYSGGTTALKRQVLMKAYGVDSTIELATVDNLDKALRERKGVIFSANVSELWAILGITQDGKHAAVATHGEYDPAGKLTAVIVNDTGVNKRFKVPANKLAQILDSGSKKLNVTTQPIWPAN